MTQMLLSSLWSQVWREIEEEIFGSKLFLKIKHVHNGKLCYSGINCIISANVTSFNLSLMIFSEQIFYAFHFSTIVTAYMRLFLLHAEVWFFKLWLFSLEPSFIPFYSSTASFVFLTLSSFRCAYMCVHWGCQPPVLGGKSPSFWGSSLLPASWPVGEIPPTNMPHDDITWKWCHQVADTVWQNS